MGGADRRRRAAHHRRVRHARGDRRAHPRSRGRRQPTGCASTSPHPSRWIRWPGSSTRCRADALSWWYGAGPREVLDGRAATEYSDVLIIGAGISGIGAAYRIHEKNPQLSYTILERRERIGGTWDLFRYPGIRSDSDIFTLSLPFEPWTRPENVADGARHPGVPDRHRAQARHRRAHPVRHPREVGGVGLGHRHLDRAHRARRRREGLPRPVPVLRHRLLRLRRALHAGVPRHRGLRRRRRASAVLARVAGLHRQAASSSSAAAPRRSA